MLDGAVAGSVFTSPPVDDVLAAIMTLSESGATGVLILVINYTGDRINFGLAAERAKSRGNVVNIYLCLRRIRLQEDSLKKLRI